MKITIKCKLDPTIRQAKILKKTLSKCLDAANYISQVAWKNKCFNRVALHHLTYYKVRKRFKLNAQIVTSVRDKVAFDYRATKKKRHVFKNAILPLNFTRTIRFVNFNKISVSTISGREKIKLQLAAYQRINLSQAIKFCDSELTQRGNKFYLNTVIEIPEKSLQRTSGVIGIDLGIRNIATLSNGQNFSGDLFQSVRKKYFKLRHSLESANTRSARRHLRKLSGREKHFLKNTNHCISKEIVKSAEKVRSAIALENLTNIRTRIKGGKTQRTMLHNWTFSQLQRFISYKAQRNGVPVLFVKPAYTSQICSVCGKLGNRSNEHFFCPSCEFKADADYNAARNIASRAAFNQPIAASVEAEGLSKNN